MNTCIIASFPRSGSHLVRYLVEIMSSRPTLGEGSLQWSKTVDGPILDRLSLIQSGKNHKYKSDEPIGYKRHIITERDYIYENLILVHRNPIESILRHALHDKSLEYIFDPKNDYLEVLSKMYGDLILEFYVKNKFKNKLLINFDELVFGSNDQIFDVLNSINIFLDIKCKTLKTILKNIQNHKMNAKLVFSKISILSEFGETPTYWQSKLNKEQLDYVTNIISKYEYKA